MTSVFFSSYSYCFFKLRTVQVDQSSFAAHDINRSLGFNKHLCTLPHSWYIKGYIKPEGLEDFWSGHHESRHLVNVANVNSMAKSRRSVPVRSTFSSNWTTRQQTILLPHLPRLKLPNKLLRNVQSPLCLMECFIVNTVHSLRQKIMPT